MSVYRKLLVIISLILPTYYNYFSWVRSVVFFATDLILFNDKIYTVNDQQLWTEAVAIKNGEIVAVGDFTDINS